ncbi:MAG: TIGR03936 family radical SAM-associated protein [Lachnospiraceae bacterium]|nr:TIGR03936 family radical SAM-associated protein [Lachnospiraceae bacterium]MDY5742512.1 TIGR03936 family radical SAM-associated protein [Lachnospiraceae bacterium]
MKIRLKFTKLGPVQYVGHLDFLRFFQKALRRAGLPAGYSNGFHPHMLMSFASPLGIGMESRGDYVDIHLDEAVARSELLNRLNACLADGVEVLDACLVREEKKDNAMAMVRYADYLVTLTVNQPDLLTNMLHAQIDKRINELLSADHLLIRQQSKKQERERDLRPHLHRLELTFADDDSKTVSLYMRLSCGSANNVKPEAILELLGLTAPFPSILRLDMMTDDFVSLAETGTREF